MPSPKLISSGTKLTLLSSQLRGCEEEEVRGKMPLSVLRGEGRGTAACAAKHQMPW